MSENELIVLRPLPGARFTLRMTVLGQDVHLECPKKDLAECYMWLESWLTTCVKPLVDAELARRAKRAEFEAENAEERKAKELAALLASIPETPDYDPVREAAERIKNQIAHTPEGKQLSLKGTTENV